MNKPLRIGLIGYQFMGKAHSHAYRDVAMFFPEVAAPERKIVCGRNRAAVSKAARQYGWEQVRSRWRDAVRSDEIDIVDIVAPVYLHKEVAVAAAQAGKHVICEKPMAKNLAEAIEMLEAVQRAGVKHMVAFNYRRIPAVVLARQMIDQGRVGRIYHWRATYLQDWSLEPSYPLSWRFQKSKAGGGTHPDVNSHLIDLARYLVGEIEEVSGVSETFIGQRPLPENFRKKGRVTGDDATLFLARFEGGALGSFEGTRMAAGRKNSLQFEINGSEGSLRFDLERLNELDYFNCKDSSGHHGFRTILLTEPTHPYIQAWWPPGHIIGWQNTFVHEIRDFLLAIDRDRAVAPDFMDGVRCQAVLEAVLVSIRKGKWIRPASLWKPPGAKR